MAKVDLMIGLGPRAICPTPLAVIQDRPLHARLAVVPTKLGGEVSIDAATAWPRTGRDTRNRAVHCGPGPSSSSISGSNADRSLRTRRRLRIPELTPPAKVK